MNMSANGETGLAAIALPHPIVRQMGVSLCKVLSMRSHEKE